MLPDGWARALGANRGLAEVEDEEGDILPARAVPDDRTMGFRVGPSTAAAPRGGEGGRRADEPIKKRHLADGRGARDVGWEGRVSASGICIIGKWYLIRFVSLGGGQT